MRHLSVLGTTPADGVVRPEGIPPKPGLRPQPGSASTPVAAGAGAGDQTLVTTNEGLSRGAIALIAMGALAVGFLWIVETKTPKSSMKEA